MMLALTEEWSSELKQVLEEAVRLSDKPWYARFLRSKQNADMINDLKGRIDQACQTFQVSAHASRLHAITNAHLRSFREVSPSKW